MPSFLICVIHECEERDEYYERKHNMEGFITVNNSNGIFNPHIPTGTYICITTEEANDIDCCDKYMQYIPEDEYPIPMMVISMEHGILTGSNQTGDTLVSLKLNIREVDETLYWRKFTINYEYNQYGVPVRMFRLVSN